MNTMLFTAWIAASQIPKIVNFVPDAAGLFPNYLPVFKEPKRTLKILTQHINQENLPKKITMLLWRSL